MAPDVPIYRRLPAYEAIWHQSHQHDRVLDICDFRLKACGGDDEKPRADSREERSNFALDKFEPRPDGTGLRWITLKNNTREIMQLLLSVSTSTLESSLEKSLFDRSSPRFGTSRYSQVYAESCCELIIPETGYSPQGSAKLDPQLAIFLPFFKWGPTSHVQSSKYPSLREFAQPSIFHGPLPHEDSKKTYQNLLPIDVHQLWLFVTGSKIIVSFQPPTYPSATEFDQLDVDLNTAVMMNVPGMTPQSAKDGDIIEDAYVMAAFLVRQTCLLQISGSLVKTPMIPFLEQVVASLSGKRIDAYDSFSESLAQKDTTYRSETGGRNPEILLLLEVIKSIEELESFLFVLQSQASVLMQMDKAYAEIQAERPLPEKATSLLQKTIDDLFRMKSEVGRLVKNATQIQTALVQLLDLKQKEMNLLETQYARLNAEQAAAQTLQAARQGKTILIFTVATIIFLPLSFVTSYFGMNVQEVTGDDGNVSQALFWKVCAPVTFAIVLIAFMVAFGPRIRIL